VFEGNEVAFSRQSEGVHLQNGSNNNLFARNHVHNNTRDGFDLDKSLGNVFVQNLVADNDINGIELDNCNDNDIVANRIIGNKQTGVSLDSSLRNVIDHNFISANGVSPSTPGSGYGAHFAMGSNNNILSYNAICDNLPAETRIRGTGNHVIQNICD
jgi:parallel beta-helix repeat protein